MEGEVHAVGGCVGSGSRLVSGLEYVTNRPDDPSRLVWSVSQSPKLPELVGWPGVRESLGSEGFSNVLFSTLYGVSDTLINQLHNFLK